MYNKAVEIFNLHQQEGNFLSRFDLQKLMKDACPRENLHSDSYLAAMQQLHNNLASHREARKSTKTSSAPHRVKTLQPIFFKQSQIKVSNNNLVLTLDRHKNYFSIRWNENISRPKFASISWVQGRGWKLNVVLDVELSSMESNFMDSEKGRDFMSIDLGVKRIAVCYESKTNSVFGISGKEMMTLSQYENKSNSSFQKKLKRKKEDSKKCKRLQRARRKERQRIENKKMDFLHKTSRLIVNRAIEGGIQAIAIGDNSGTHTRTNVGGNNQKVQQFPERKLKNLIKQKFERIGGVVVDIPEYYTSKECPSCGTHNTPKNREYSCGCGFSYDRDGVGSMNIGKRYLSKVSFGCVFDMSERSCGLTPPVFMRFKSNLSHKNMSNTTKRV